MSLLEKGLIRLHENYLSLPSLTCFRCALEPTVTFVRLKNTFNLKKALVKRGGGKKKRGGRGGEVSFSFLAAPQFSVNILFQANNLVLLF